MYRNATYIYLLYTGPRYQLDKESICTLMKLAPLIFGFEFRFHAIHLSTFVQQLILFVQPLQYHKFVKLTPPNVIFETFLFRLSIFFQRKCLFHQPPLKSMNKLITFTIFSRNTKFHFSKLVFTFSLSMFM